MADACEVCGDPVTAHGLCMKHYARKRRTGSVYTKDEQRDQLIELLFAALHDDSLTGEATKRAKEMGYGSQAR